MGSPGHLVRASLGRVVSAHPVNNAFTSPRGHPFGGGDVHHISDIADISLPLCNPLNPYGIH